MNVKIHFTLPKFNALHSVFIIATAFLLTSIFAIFFSLDNKNLAKMYAEKFSFHDCVSPVTSISVPLGFASNTRINNQQILTPKTFKEMGFTYGNSTTISRFFMMSETVKVCDIPTINSTYAKTQDTLDSTDPANAKNTTMNINFSSPKQVLKIYDSPSKIFTIDVNVCENTPPAKTGQTTEILCTKADYNNVNQKLSYGKEYTVIATIKDQDTIVRQDHLKIATIGYIALHPKSNANSVGYKEGIVFEANQPLKNCFFTFKNGDKQIQYKQEVTGATVSLQPDNDLPLSSNYSVVGKCENDDSIMEKAITFDFKTAPQFEVTNYSPTFSYNSATICVDFNAPLSWGVDQITLNGASGKFSKSSDTRACTNVNNGGSNKTYAVTVPTSVGSTKTGNLLKQYSNKTAVNNYPIVTVLLPTTLYHQPYSLSCEASSIKIALSAFGIHQGEDTIMGAIGYDSPKAKECADGSTPTTKANGFLGCTTSNAIWGDPTKGFVGDINGINGSTGWGVDNYAALKGAKAYAGNSYNLNGANWKTPLTEVGKGHPVVYWTENKTKTAAAAECWVTTGGKSVCWKSTHVKTIVGYTYNTDTSAYSNITIYDPYYGVLKLTQSAFMGSWNSYGGMGIVVVK